MTSIWTDERVETLKTLWSAGHSARDIAGKIGNGMITRNAVLGKIDRLELPKRAIRPGRRASTKTKPEKIRLTLFTTPVLQMPKIKADAPPIPVETDNPAKLVSLTELSDTACKWPYGADPVMFGCGCKRVPGKAYCAGHIRRAADRRPRAARPRIELVRDNSLEFA